jgi:hypothetical protein
MTSYREASAASPDLVGAARVRSGVPLRNPTSAFPTAAKSRYLAMNARVGFETVPAEGCETFAPSNEDRVLPVTPKPEPKIRASGVPIPRGLETGQPPGTVRGGRSRQLAWLPVSKRS